MHALENIGEDQAPRAINETAESARTSALATGGWGLGYPDFLRIAAPFPLPGLGRGPDRAALLESSWNETWPGHPRSLAEWAGSTARGDLPAIAFQTTLAESGQTLCFKTFSLPPHLAPRSLDFFDLHPGSDVDVVTAARLSATFPYVTPAARVHPSLLAEGDPDARGYHVVDGGYTDNQGVLSAVLWLASCFLDADVRSEATAQRPARNVLDDHGELFVLLLRPFPPAPAPEPASSVEAAFLGPITALSQSRGSGQFERNELALELFRASLAGHPLHIVRLRYPAAGDDSGNERLSLSWHLTRAEMAAQRTAFERLDPALLTELDRVFERR